ncbi:MULTISPECIES: rhomboid family intramembrane serine protease [unclassified Nocardiopsis]|uniref:rhomboid family intramembrane serine protease n=1 Tax=unclassified Nocardiopsis TaxID=2649073 RepID=UPI00191566FF|nr:MULTISPECIES: rhomboid family intramembrane serine protease [unclassified Nocardiopsis]
MTASPPSGASSEPGPHASRTCYRHSDRETGVSCHRCGRPICPDCMVEASVGFHCPTCVSEGNRGVRRARTAFGGRPVAKPYVTWTILGLMVAGFIAQLGTSDPVGRAGSSPLVWEFAMLGFGHTEDGALLGVLGGDWYRLITAAFLHGSVFHLLFNGYAMYVLGTQLESWLGHGRFLALWVLGALAGSVLSVLAAPAQFSVGASGAIFALFGAVFVIGRRLRLDLRMVGVLLAVNLVLTFVVPQISWTAHIGGLVAGFLLGAVFAYLPGRSAGNTARTVTHVLLTAAFAALLVALVVTAPLIVLS